MRTRDTGCDVGEGVTRGMEAGWSADSSFRPQALGNQERLGRAVGVALEPQP